MLIIQLYQYDRIKIRLHLLAVRIRVLLREPRLLYTTRPKRQRLRVTKNSVIPRVHFWSTPLTMGHLKGVSGEHRNLGLHLTFMKNGSLTLTLLSTISYSVESAIFKGLRVRWVQVWEEKNSTPPPVDPHFRIIVEPSKTPTSRRAQRSTFPWCGAMRDGDSDTFYTGHDTQQSVTHPTNFFLN